MKRIALLAAAFLAATASLFASDAPSGKKEVGIFYYLVICIKYIVKHVRDPLPVILFEISITVEFAYLPGQCACYFI